MATPGYTSDCNITLGFEENHSTWRHHPWHVQIIKHQSITLDCNTTLGLHTTIANGNACIMLDITILGNKIGVTILGDVIGITILGNAMGVMILGNVIGVIILGNAAPKVITVAMFVIIWCGLLQY